MPMPSDEIQLLITGYVLGDLSPEEAAELQQLSAQDPAIAEEIAQMQKVLETSYAPPELAPPGHLRSAILAQVQTTQSATNLPTIPRSRQLLTWRTGMEVAAATLIITLGINNYHLRQTLQTSQIEMQRYATLTYVLDATNRRNQAAATVVVNPNTLEATITVRNLPPLPPGKVYALWTVLQPDAPFTTDAKRAILTDVFQVDDRGSFSQAIAVPAAFRSKELVTKVAVTIEDSKSPQKHTGTPILITGLVQ